MQYREKDYFSGSAAVEVLVGAEPITIVKKFSLDTVLERNLRGVKPSNRAAWRFTRQLEGLYQMRGHWALLKLKKTLLENIGVQTSFAKTEPVGEVEVTYQIYPARIHVKANFRAVQSERLQRMFMLNEQSSRHFARYRDSTGTVLIDDEIGAWKTVDADWAHMSSRDDHVGFRLRNVEDTSLRRGREFLEGAFDWAGLDYEIRPSQTGFEYDIEIIGGSDHK